MAGLLCHRYKTREVHSQIAIFTKRLNNGYAATSVCGQRIGDRIGFHFVVDAKLHERLVDRLGSCFKVGKRLPQPRECLPDLA